jgi:hypothetical protein
MRQKIRHQKKKIKKFALLLLLLLPLKLPEELPSVEEALKILVAAMKALETPDLSKTEVLRLRSIIQATSAYQVKVAE